MNMIKFAELISFITNVTGNRFNSDTIAGIEQRINSKIDDESRECKINLVPLFNFIAEGKKIDAIREHRALTGFGLKESKDEIERVMK